MEIYRTFRIKYWKYSYIRQQFCSNCNYCPLPDIKCDGHCLINSYNDPSWDVVNLYICYTLDWCSRDLDTDFALGNCLFRSVKLTKNADPDKCKYSSYGIGFDSRSQFSFTDGSMDRKIHRKTPLPESLF